jgi:hypothetical protein
MGQTLMHLKVTVPDNWLTASDNAHLLNNLKEECYLFSDN